MIRRHPIIQRVRQAPGVITNPPFVFHPEEISGLSLWYDPQDASTITESGGKISQMDDKSSNGYDATQGTGANQPSYMTVGGIDSVVFDRSNSNYMVADAAASLCLSPYTIFMVGEAVSHVLQFFCSFHLTNSNRNLFGLTAGGSARWVMFDTTSFYNIADAEDYIDQRLVVTVLVNNSSATCYTNLDEQLSPAASLPITANRFSLGMEWDASPSDFWDGTFQQLLIYNRILSNNERQMVTQWLIRKLNITDN